MNTKHSELFYISSNLFDNRRLKRRISKWIENLRERQNVYRAQMRPQTYTPISKTERGRRRCQLILPRRQVAAMLQADITIDLLSDDDGDVSQPNAEPPKLPATVGGFLHNSGSLQLSTVPNITLVPVELAPAHNSTMLLIPAASNRGNCNDKPHKRFENAICSTTSPFTDSIVLTSDEEVDKEVDYGRRKIMRSPPPLAPLTFSDGVEEVTVSLVPGNSTTSSCQARQRRRQLLNPSVHKNTSSCNIPGTTSPENNLDRFLRVEVSNDVSGMLPDETTVHTVIANRIYELSLSKLREGLASSGVPEYAHDLLPEQLQKLSPAMRAKMAPMVAPSPPAPISLKLSSDLSISLISDDDDCDGSNAGGVKDIDMLHPVVAAEAHAAAKLLKQQQPQLSVVQHLQYPGHLSPVALPVVALAATPPSLTVPLTRRRKLG